MNHDEMAEIASERSDHHDRVVSELEPAILDSLNATDPSLPVLEIGNREGGSCLVLMWNVWNLGQRREVVTCDLNDPWQESRDGTGAAFIPKWAETFELDHIHYKMAEAWFVRDEAPKRTWGFVYLDADHGEGAVTDDMRLLQPYLAKGCILAVDDVNEWNGSLPEIEGMEMVDFHVDEGTWPQKDAKHHFMCWRKL